MATKRPQMNEQEQVRRAIQRALANGGASCVTRIRYGLYSVESASRPGQAHRVSVDDAGTYLCGCEAGMAGRAYCWHRAAVYVAKIEKASGGRVVAPAVEVETPAELPANVVTLRPTTVRHPRMQVAL